jgi:hypothetical protein
VEYEEVTLLPLNHPAAIEQHLGVEMPSLKG